MLVVDDEPKLLRSLRRNYERKEFEVRTALDRREALAFAEDTAPDVAIVDLHLASYEEGLFVVEEIRGLCPSSWIVLISGAVSASTASEARDLGANAIVEKPADSLAYLAAEPLPDDVERFPTLAEMKRAHVQRALRIVDHNHTRAADLLGINRSTLLRTLTRWGMR